jgi:hypothetical protein
MARAGDEGKESSECAAAKRESGRSHEPKE